MIKKVFSLYDEKSEAYIQPFFLDTLGQFARAMSDCLSDPNHQFARHTADYSCYLLGEFDDNTGAFNTNVRRSLGALVEFRSKPVPASKLVHFDGGCESCDQ